jgi:hypothetical protein
MAVALVIQHAMRMLGIFIFGLHFSTLSDKHSTIFGRNSKYKIVF